MPSRTPRLNYSMTRNEHTKKWYQVFDATNKNELVFEGYKEDVCTYLCISDGIMYRCVRYNKPTRDGYLIRNAGRIDKIDNTEERRKKGRPRKEERKKESAYDVAKKMLDIYGNTIIYKDFEKIPEKLKEEGYIVKTKYEPKRVIKRIETKKAEVFRECMILELIKKEGEKK